MGGANSCAVWYSEVKVISRLTRLKNDDRPSNPQSEAQPLNKRNDV